MNRSLHGIVALLLVANAHSAEPSAKSLKQCPNGHPTLKDVPIVYGLPPFKGPAAEKWRKSVENLEFVSGGCVIPPDSPKHQVICTTCRFAHSIFSIREPQYGTWMRTSPDATSFPRPITEVARSFPVPAGEQQEGPVTYTQGLSDSLELLFDGVSYRTTQPPEQIKAEVNKWLKERDITCKFTTQPHIITLDGTARDIMEWQTKELSVSIRMHHEHSDKTSWIDATFYRRP